MWGRGRPLSAYTIELRVAYKRGKILGALRGKGAFFLVQATESKLDESILVLRTKLDLLYGQSTILQEIPLLWGIWAEKHTIWDESNS